MAHYIESRGKFGYAPETQLARESICNGIVDVIGEMATDYHISFIEDKIPSPRKDYELLFAKKLEEAYKLSEDLADCCYKHQQETIKASKINKMD